MCCYSCWLPTPLWRRTEWWTEMKWGTLCSQKTGRAGLQIVRYSQELILWVQFLFSSVQLLSLVRILATPWNAACQASPSITNPRAYSYSCLSSWWCHPTFLSSVIPFSSCLQCFPEIRVFSNELAFCITWPKYWGFSFSISPSNEYSGLISFRMDWLDLLAVQGTLKSLLQHHSSKASILRHSGTQLSL